MKFIQQIFRIFTFGLVGSIVCGCASQELDLTQKLIIAMYGAYTARDGVTGNAEPKNHTYTLENITLTNASDSSTEDVLEETDVELKIINRTQIIHEVDMTDYDGVNFSTITVTLACDVTAYGPLGEELSFTLTNPVITHTETFTVEAAKEERLNIEVNWKNTIDLDSEAETESIEEPGFSTAFAGD